MEASVPSAERQTTVAGEARFVGVGLHTGAPCTVTVAPASSDFGIRWRRTDLPDEPVIPARAEFVVATDRATTIGTGDARVQTVEHLMAALAGVGIHNALVRIDGPEPPFLDGAAAAFAAGLLEAGVAALDAPLRRRRLQRPVAASEGGAHIVALPADEFRVSYTFVSDSRALGVQFAEHRIARDEFVREVAPARTVGWLAEVEALRRRGLALGVTEDAAVVVDGDTLVTPMKFPNEVARHKVLDIVGDLALAGPFAAHVIALRSGHRLHVELARRLAASTSTPFTEEETVKG